MRDVAAFGLGIAAVALAVLAWPLLRLSSACSRRAGALLEVSSEPETSPAAVVLPVRPVNATSICDMSLMSVQQ